MEGADFRLIGQMIAHGCTAGACRVWARKEPTAARGLTKAADFHSRRAAALADELTKARDAVAAAPVRRQSG